MSDLDPLDRAEANLDRALRLLKVTAVLVAITLAILILRLTGVVA